MEKFSLNRMRALKEAEKEAITALIAEEKGRSRAHYALQVTPDQTPQVIAEIKQSSPSLGAIATVNPVSQAALYVTGGAAAISILTEKNYFSGSWKILKEVARAVQVPVLCKEFIYYKEQVDLAYLYGADAVLLIARELSDSELAELYNYIQKKKMLPLVEIYAQDELSKVLPLEPEILMVNMRNLTTLEMTIEHGIATLNRIPSGIARVSASGIKKKEDITAIYRQTGASYFLIGSAIMASGDPKQFLRGLHHVC